MDITDQAPGAPGFPLNWCEGTKQMVGTSLGPAQIWFTVGRGILNEVYYPRVDIPQLRDLGIIVADGAGISGVSDGWQDFHRNGRMTWHYPEPATGAFRATPSGRPSGAGKPGDRRPDPEGGSAPGALLVPLHR